MNKKVNLLLGASVYLIMAMFTGASQTFALQEHGHKSPHGGEVRTMGDNHVEFLVAEGHDGKDYIVVYLLNKDLETIPVGKNVEGVVYLTFPDKTKQTVKLILTSEPFSDEHGNHDEGHEDEEKHDEHNDEAEDHKNGEHENENIPYLRAEIELGSIDNFKAVVSIKINQTRKNLRFNYTKEEHGHEEGDEHE